MAVDSASQKEDALGQTFASEELAKEPGFAYRLDTAKLKREQEGTAYRNNIVHGEEADEEDHKATQQQNQPACNKQHYTASRSSAVIILQQINSVHGSEVQRHTALPGED